MQPNGWTLPWANNIIVPLGRVFWNDSRLVLFLLPDWKNKWTLCKKVVVLSHKKKTKSMICHLLASSFLLAAQLTAFHYFVFSPPLAQVLAPQREEKEEEEEEEEEEEGLRQPSTGLWAQIIFSCELSRGHMFEGKHQPIFFSLPPSPDSFLLTKTQHRNEEQKSCMERGERGRAGRTIKNV